MLRTQEQQAAIETGSIDTRHLRGDGLCTFILQQDATTSQQIAIVYDHGTHPAEVSVSSAENGLFVITADGVTIAIIAGHDADALTENEVVFIERPANLRIC